MTTGDAIQHFALQDRSAKLCALNFANGSTVGGGYKNGAQAQEEDLCRRIPCLYTTLLQAKRAGLYDFGPCTCRSLDQPAKYTEILFTPNLLLVRGSEREGFMLLPAERQATVHMVHAAAPNLKFATTPEINDEGLLLTTLKSVFIAPRMSMPEAQADRCVLILGAWGCGAFGGDPSQIADLFCRTLVQEKLGRLYREVHFAIPAGDDNNGEVFRSTFQRHKIAFSEVVPTGGVI